MSTESRGRVVVLLILAVSVIGMAGVLYATRWGVGTSPDSSTYIGSARSLIAGRGLSLTDADGRQEPMTFMAPLYAVVLAGAGLPGGDPESAARWLNALLLAANLVLVGMSVRRLVPASSRLPVFASLIALTAGPLLTIHAYAWSEPLFILLGFGGLHLVAVHISGGTRTSLLAGCVLLGLAWLTRYAGAPFVATGVIGILLLGRGGRWDRLKDACLAGFAGTLPLALWTIRNLLQGGSGTGRTFGFHPIARSDAWNAVFTVTNWLQVPAGTPGIVRLCILGTIAAGLAAIWARRSESAFHDAEPRPASNTGIHAVLALVFLVIYAVFLVVSISFFDGNIPLDDRILSPAYVASLLLICAGVARLTATEGNRRFVPTAVAVLGLALLAVSAPNAAGRLAESHERGIGFSAPAWRQSELIKFAHELPARRPVFSNSPDAIYLVAGRPALRLPSRMDALSRRPNPHYEADLAAAREVIERRDGVIVHFHRVERPSAPNTLEYEKVLGLQVIRREPDGLIYAIGR